MGLSSFAGTQKAPVMAKRKLSRCDCRGSFKFMENGSLGKVSYSHFMAVSCIVSDIIQDIGRKSGFFHTPFH